MYEKTTEKIVEALLKTPEGYRCLDSLVNQYICSEREDLLPDPSWKENDKKKGVQCHEGSLRLKLLQDKVNAGEDGHWFFSFALSGKFMQQDTYKNEDGRVTVETLADILADIREYLETKEWGKEWYYQGMTEEEVDSYNSFFGYTDTEEVLRKKIETRTVAFKLYLNITFAIENDHIWFDEIYLSHKEDGEYIVDEEQNPRYKKELTLVFEGKNKKEQGEILCADWNGEMPDGSSPLDLLIALESPAAEMFYENYVYIELTRELTGWLDETIHDKSVLRKLMEDDISLSKASVNYSKANIRFMEFVNKKEEKVVRYAFKQYKEENNEKNKADGITVNVTFKQVGCYIEFVGIYLSRQEHRGKTQELKHFLHNLSNKKEYLMVNLLKIAGQVKGDIKKIETMKGIVSDTLSRYAIKDEEDVLLRFFRFQVFKDKRCISGAETARFNVLVKSNEEARSLKCLRDISAKVSEELHIFENIQEVTEKDLLDAEEEAIEWFAGSDLIMIHGCKERPKKQEHGTGLADEANRKAIERYDRVWKRIAEAAKKPNAPRMIIIADDIVYRRTFSKNPEIFERLCRYHLEIPEIPQEEVERVCLERLENSGLEIPDDTKNTFKTWFSEAYPRSELKGEEFIDDLFNNRIYADFFSRRRERMVLTSELIPEREKLREPEELFEDLNKLAGLGQVKEELRRMYDKRVALGGLNQEPEHMCFLGNPGTGKTTVAKMVAELLYGMKLIKFNHVVEKKAMELTSLYVSGTTELATNIIKEASGGVLFIDEAYGLGRKGNNHSQEALDVLIQEMEDVDNPERPVVILAGYEKEMRELMAANPGLESRIKRFVHFEDYNEDELFEILCGMLEKKQFRLDVPEECIERFRKEGFKLDYLPEKLSGLSDLIKEKKSKEFFGNAREMRTLCDELIERWATAWAENKRNAKNVSDESSQEKVITKDHIDALKAKTKDGIKELIGLTDLKEKLDEFEARVKYAAELRRNGTYIPDSNMHMLFVGNPGTGKTTVAKRLADKLCRIGVLPTNKCIVVESKDLIRYQNNKTPAQITEDFIKRAIGGILFVDEAYTLVTSEGLKAIEVLLTAMEEHKDDTIFIFAGYLKEMDDFLSTNPGLKSRIANRFEFPDYKPAELIEILYLEMKRTGETEDKRLRFADNDKVIEKLLEILEMFSAMPDFGNGRFVGSLFRQIIDKHATRYKKGNQEDIRTLTAEDIPTIQEMLRVAYGKEGIADPEKIKGEILNRVAHHEMGHAVVSLETDGDTPIEKISVRGAYGSYGRVSYHPDGESLYTEQELKNRLTMLLGGRNAERVFFGDSSAGCASDYESAKNLAKMMIEHWAMGELGISKEMDFLREADDRATKILYNNRDFIDAVASKLVEMGELSGEQIKKLYRTYKDDGLQSLNNEIKAMKAIDGTNALEKIKKTLVDKGLL